MLHCIMGKVRVDGMVNIRNESSIKSTLKYLCTKHIKLNITASCSNFPTAFLSLPRTRQSTAQAAGDGSLASVELRSGNSWRKLENSPARS